MCNLSSRSSATLLINPLPLFSSLVRAAIAILFFRGRLTLHLLSTSLFDAYQCFSLLSSIILLLPNELSDLLGSRNFSWLQEGLVLGLISSDLYVCPLDQFLRLSDLLDESLLRSIIKLS